MISRLRSISSRLALASVATVVALLAAEGAARILGARSLYLDPALFAPHPSTVYANRPGFHGAYAGAFVRINSLGCRGAEWIAASRGKLVLVLGDSLAFGQGVGEEETFSEVLRRELRKRFGVGVNVLNCGVPGFNTTNSAARLRELAPLVVPDVVILCYTDNDTDPQLFTAFVDGVPVTASGEYHVRQDWLRRVSTFFYRHSALYALARKAEKSLRRQVPPNLGSYEAHLRRAFDHSNAGFRRSMSALRDMATWLRKRGIPFFVAVWSRLPDGRPDPYADTVVRFASKMGIPAARISPLRPGEDPESLVLPYDGHPNALAHHRIGQAIARQIVDRNLLASRGSSVRLPRSSN